MTKVYIADNIDGVNEAMVVAPNLTEAARRIGTTVYDMRRYGWHVAEGDDADAYLKMRHSCAVYRPINRRLAWRLRPWSRTELSAVKPEGEAR